MKYNDIEVSTGAAAILVGAKNCLPAGSITFVGSFFDRALAYSVAKELGIKVSAASGYSYVYNENDYKSVVAYIGELLNELRLD